VIKTINDNLISTDEEQEDIEKKIDTTIDTLIDDIEYHDDYSRLRDYLKSITKINIQLFKKTNDLEDEIMKIRAEIFHNELTAEDLRELLLIDYEEE